MKIPFFLFYLILALRRVFYTLFYCIDTLVLKRKSKIIVLCYHSIADNNWRFTVPLEQFRRQIQYLLEKGYEFITLEEVLSYLLGQKNISKPSVVVTFDDGYAGYYQNSYDR